MQKLNKRTLNKIVTNFIFLNILTALCFLYLIAETKYRFVEVLFIPGIISEEQFDINMKESQRKDLGKAYELWVLKNYNKYKENYYLKESLSYEEKKILGDKFFVYFNKKYHLWIGYLILAGQLICYLVIYLAFNKALIKKVFYFSFSIFILFVVFYEIFGASMLTNSWP